MALDVVDAGAREAAVHDALAAFGRIDLLATIAGRGSLGAVEDARTRTARGELRRPGPLIAVLGVWMGHEVRTRTTSAKRSDTSLDEVR